MHNTIAVYLQTLLPITLFPIIVPQLSCEQQRSLFYSPSVITLLGTDDIWFKVPRKLFPPKMVILCPAMCWHPPRVGPCIAPVVLE